MPIISVRANENHRCKKSQSCKNKVVGQAIMNLWELNYFVVHLSYVLSNWYVKHA